MRVVFIILTIIMSASTALAGGWTPMLSSHTYGPKRIIAVDKGAQQLIVLEQRSPLHEVRRFPCTTGQSMGDKAVEGDMRTPEGVYFVGHRINRKLDWGLYGNIAYSLNYPNPIDRIKGKTGSGIWLHGRGKTFLPRDTMGCVALKVPDMKNVALDAVYGTPVVIANDVNWSAEPGESEVTALTLAKMLEAWAHDWGAKDDKFFSYYDASLLELSEGLDFEGFEEHKRNIFASQPWIQVMVGNVQAVPGPGYWVTWFDQYYRTKGMASTTGKRFYWVQDDQGRWRIAGREYVPASEQLDAKYLASKEGEARALVEKWREAWLKQDAEAYENFYESDARQGDRKGAADIAEYKKTLWGEKPPVRLEVDDLKVALHPMGLKVAFDQVFADASGYADRGRKTLILVPEGDTWKIDSEQWRRMR
ncbi:L,D-transpeptidase family protein [uncultured Pseudodesulfovibrio sp.]|uniref:L,D-transpeptidase family protein n=1 Tax=uncultured Pseudodesulfovibrio sp. TaxID=2035858 RepID=UPI0029C7674A|nr:L,D-transpeptidase family protein [uncultured Pseudodesulfovibrio sp.]